MCLTSCLMGENKILILKATKDTIDDIIEKGIYTLNNLPSNYNQFEKFILVDEKDSNGNLVLAVGNIREPYVINETSNDLNVFNNCKWGYELSNVVDLRGNIITLQDIFMDENLDRINYAVQF
ncbi:hypothetical protein [Clostridium sp.]|uniref:hypothetical protein n=1 Tax=Clostridium sp. TaxID=1506 RepID=UPI0025B93C72|nr:hypothetical protein [Clostridium sp.]